MISSDDYGKRISEEMTSEIFESEFPRVTDRSVEVLSHGEASQAPDCVAMIDGVEMGVELTAIHAADAGDVVAEVYRLSQKKSASYIPRGIFSRPIILLCTLDWPSRDVEGPALYDIYPDIEEMTVPDDFNALGFTEIWLMDAGVTYTSRKDPRCPADFFCFWPADKFGFWDRARRRRPYWARMVEQRI
jgi:hypothetical protein